MSAHDLVSDTIRLITAAGGQVKAIPPEGSRGARFAAGGVILAGLAIVELMEAHLLVADGVHDYRLSTMQREGHQAWE